MIPRIGAFLFCLLSGWELWAAPSPKIPGEILTESESIRAKTRVSKTKKSAPVKQQKLWTAPSIEAQLSADATLVAMGQGAIFVPSFTEPRLEPELRITSSDGELQARSGERIVLKPGNYDIFVGSGNKDQQMRFRSVVLEGQTTLLEPLWGGLAIESIDKNGNYLDESYEIWRLSDAASFGLGYGMEERRLQDIRTWILPPGKYRITAAGAGFASLVNYITVQVNPGELLPIELVFDPETGNMLAGGIRSEKDNSGGTRNWHFGMRLGSTASYENRVIRSRVQSASLNILTDLRLRLRFDNTLYMGLTEFLTKNLFERSRNVALHAISDELQLRSLWVRRLTPWMGPYLRAKLYTHLLAENVTPETEGDTITFVGPPERHYLYGEHLRIKSPGFPLEFGEGAGVNLELFNSYTLESSTQIGVAARQTIVRNSLISTDLKETRWLPNASSRSFGAENALTIRIRMGSFVTIDLRSDLFFPNFDLEAYEVDELTAEVRLHLTRNVELSFTGQIIDNQKESTAELSDLESRFENANSFLLRVSINI